MFAQQLSDPPPPSPQGLALSVVFYSKDERTALLMVQDLYLIPYF